MQKLNAIRFALPAASTAQVCRGWREICALLGAPGFKSFTDLLAQVYGFYGYSVLGTGIESEIWGFIERFVHLGNLAWLYNLLLGRG